MMWVAELPEVFVHPRFCRATEEVVVYVAFRSKSFSPFQTSEETKDDPAYR